MAHKMKIIREKRKRVSKKQKKRSTRLTIKTIWQKLKSCKHDKNWTNALDPCNLQQQRHFSLEKIETALSFTSIVMSHIDYTSTIALFCQTKANHTASMKERKWYCNSWRAWATKEWMKEDCIIISVSWISSIWSQTT